MRYTWIARAGAASALAAVGALVAAPAFAASDDVQTDTVLWDGVDDDTGEITDAIALSHDLWGSGVDVYGWFNTDAFDALFDIATVSYGSDSVRLGLDGDLTPVSTDYVDFGTTVLSGTAQVSLSDEDPVEPADHDFTVTVTLTIEGSYAAWNVEVEPSVTEDDVAAAMVSDIVVDVEGNLGSDGGTVWEQTGPDSFISHDEFEFASDNSFDHVIAWKMLGEAAVADVEDGDDVAAFFATLGEAGEVTFMLSLQSYDACSIDEAVAAQRAAAPTLDATFGENLETILTPNCWIPGTMPQVSAGEPFDVELPLTFSDEIVAMLSDSLAVVDAPVVVVPLDVPEGVSAEALHDLNTGEWTLHLSGVIANPGATTLRFGTFFDLDTSEIGYLETSGGSERMEVEGPSLPGLWEIPVNVAGAAPTDPQSGDDGAGADAGADGDELAATGVEASVSFTAAAILASLGVAAVIGSRRRV
ncbi:LPXTG cell wall anchor domain-containing protein [Demequina sp. NBRC 110052]|uniref:LPXTG cell wall anchor domain-containing protein n=1 Tax=Demequina sp. NBRC 110052 TaxID=1570341 RepID=UPI0009FC2424|nr:LPXTG cell wall anchor domain-containing protein [Demequina sp. NBRC 110052]